MQNIQPSIKSLAQLFRDRLFSIPDYQRRYSWTKRERSALFGDIEKLDARGNDSSHYLATVVCLRSGNIVLGVNEFIKLDIVDGQQRLTTLILLLKSIQLQFDSNIENESLYAKEIQELLVKPHSDRLMLLQTNHDTSYRFSNFLKKGETDEPEQAETLADLEILEAIDECKNFVDKWSENGKALDLLTKLILNHLYVVLHEISDEKIVYTVFEVLNSRGLEVSWFDRLKSNLMGRAYELESIDNEELIKTLKNIWGMIYSEVGLHKGLDTEILRYAATLYQNSTPSRPLSERDSVAEFQRRSDSANDIETIALFLLTVTRACIKIRSNHRINAVTRINQARLLAVALHLRSNLEENEKDKLLAQWEKITFRIYGLLKNDARIRVGDYIRLAWKIHNEELPVDDILNDMLAIGADFSIDDAVEKIRNDNNCYEYWQNELRYLMFRYEKHLEESLGRTYSNEQWQKIWLESSSKSIDHIWASSQAPECVRHNLGNLLIIPPQLNSSLQDSDYQLKRDYYVQTGLLIAQEVAEEPNWTENTILNRQTKLLDWIRDEWSDD